LKREKVREILESSSFAAQRSNDIQKYQSSNYKKQNTLFLFFATTIDDIQNINILNTKFERVFGHETLSPSFRRASISAKPPFVASSLSLLAFVPLFLFSLFGPDGPWC